MDLKELVAIGGISGLHKIIGRSKNGLILETLSEPKKRFATGMHDKVSVLEDISMYTLEGDVPLAQVFVKLNNLGKETPDTKADIKTIRAYVNEAVALDNERVYDSDVKKLLTWFNLLKDKLDFTALAEEKDAETAETEAATEGDEKAKKASAKPSTKVSATTPKVPKAAAPKDTPKANTKGAAGNKNTYRPKSV